jgi:hypothetical protein
MRHTAHALLLVLLVLVHTTSASALPIMGYLEGTAASGWQGTYGVQLTDGSFVTGVNQISGFPDHGFQSLPLTIGGCTTGTSGCRTIQNLVTSTSLTMSNLHVLNLAASTTLGSLGSVSWGTQGIWLLPGDPAPTAAVLAIANGTLGGTTLTRSTFSFGFNSTLTASFVSVTGGQALSSLRLDFTDGTAPPTSRTFSDGTVFINNGLPVALGTPLSAQSVPLSSTLLPMTLGLAGLFWWHAAARKGLSNV